jgi:prefoldin subunit 5
MNDNEKIIRDIIKRESLRIIKESQASFLIESSTGVDAETKMSMKRLNDYIGLLDKNLEKLNNEESSAMDAEDFLSLKDIKKSQLSELTALIKTYEKKVELLNVQKQELEEAFSDVDTKGAGIFKNQEINEFSAEEFQKGWGLRIETDNYFVDLVKQMEDTNNFKVVNSNITGLKPGFVIAVPVLKIGGEGSLKIYRNSGGNRFEELEKPLVMRNIRRMFKNPQ